MQRGEVTLAFRRWQRPRVLPGTRLRTAVGVLEVRSVTQVAAGSLTEADARAAGLGSLAILLEFLRARAVGSVYRIELRYAGPDPRLELRERTEIEPDELRALAARLSGWPIAYLELISRSPSVRADVLAGGLGLETQSFKRRVRSLKELGLTESLRPGYRLSPRGTAVLRSLRQMGVS